MDLKPFLYQNKPVFNSIFPFHGLFFFLIYLLDLRGRKSEIAPTHCFSSKCPQQLVLGQVSHDGGRDPVTWAMTFCHPGCVLAGSWHWEHSHKGCGPPMGGLKAWGQMPPAPVKMKVCRPVTEVTWRCYAVGSKAKGPIARGTGSLWKHSPKARRQSPLWEPQGEPALPTPWIESVSPSKL